jgi:hypothetical protein
MKQFFKSKRVHSLNEFLRKKKCEITSTCIGGLNVSFKGRLRGVRRSRKTVSNFGSITPSTLSVVVNNHQKNIRTK